eukprot:CAMPEP_0116885648 /NCGR_PEP_ID=MMETSP0463-20121206/19134_1 /TAXON_ID=181622 /ORGANISM="Strombidinopsis sp, Strain SopsisLIS2011" /LENGTH=57 /DNA_ID=CAMNT_0004544551 /DNA_START=275 /DNA_END=448 /DNA_ORIENTATION=-
MRKNNEEEYNFDVVGIEYSSGESDSEFVMSDYGGENASSEFSLVESVLTSERSFFDC